MAVVFPLKQIEFDSFIDFCRYFKIVSSKIVGLNGTDEELIIEELQKFNNERWIINFIDNKNEGYFILQQLEM